jgi:dephospho-CoA kinase
VVVIGLTGGPGTGKSTVASMLARRGAAVIEADRLGHQAYAPGTEGWRTVVEAFGPEIVGPDGTIDRRRLGAIVFSDPEKLHRLNLIIHPIIRRLITEQLERFRREGVRVVVIEAALLFEAGWEDLVDEVWVTEAPAEVAIARYVARTGLPEAEVRRRVAAQLDAAEKVRRAHRVIDTSGTLAAVERQVERLWDELTARTAGKDP